MIAPESDMSATRKPDMSAARKRARGCSWSVTTRNDLRARAVLVVIQRGEKVIGPRFIRLLDEIRAQGSVRQAALELGIGYRHAIAWIRRAEQALDRPLVVRRTGGAAGGGSALTAEGIALIRAYDRISKAIGKVVERVGRDIVGERGA
jgi:molybdate transport system regulatory protein